ncbi:MAG: hypothetical protein ACK4F7_11385, partial [Inhella sp.]
DLVQVFLMALARYSLGTLRSSVQALGSTFGHCGLDRRDQGFQLPAELRAQVEVLHRCRNQPEEPLREVVRRRPAGRLEKSAVDASVKVVLTLD